MVSCAPNMAGTKSLLNYSLAAVKCGGFSYLSQWPLTGCHWNLLSSCKLRRFPPLSDQKQFCIILCHHRWSRILAIFVIWGLSHYNVVILSVMAYEITGAWTVSSNVCGGANQRKHQSSTSLAIVRRTHRRWREDYYHKMPVMRKMFPFDDVIVLMGHKASSRGQVLVSHLKIVHHMMRDMTGAILFPNRYVMYRFQRFMLSRRCFVVAKASVITGNWTTTLQWRHNDHDSVSNHQPHGYLLNRLFGRRSKKTSKLRVTGLCAGNSPGPVTRKMFPLDDVIMEEINLPQHWPFVKDIFW